MSNRDVVIVEYGLGNLHSVNKAVAAVGGNPVITGDKSAIAAAEKVICREWEPLATVWRILNGPG